MGTCWLGCVPKNAKTGTCWLGCVPKNAKMGTRWLGYVPKNGIWGMYSSAHTAHGLHSALLSGCEEIC